MLTNPKLYPDKTGWWVMNEKNFMGNCYYHLYKCNNLYTLHQVGTYEPLFKKTTLEIIQKEVATRFPSWFYMEGGHESELDYGDSLPEKKIPFLIKKEPN